MRLRLFLLTLLALSAFGAGNVDLSISGLSLGMSLNDALAKIGPGFQFVKINLQGKDAASASATAAQTSVLAIKGAEEDVWVLMTLNGQLTYIDHFVQFKDGEEPSLADTRARLIDKFGPPSSEPNRRDPQWIYDQSGQHIPWEKINAGPSTTLLHCLRGNNDTIRLNSPNFKVFQGIEAPQYIQEGCYVRARTIMEPVQNNPELLKTFSVSVLDNGKIYAWISGKGKQLTEAQKKAAEDASKKGIKAPM